MNAKIGIIGGSGLYKMAGISVVDEMEVPTPFGDPSDRYTIGETGGVRVAFLARHGKGHRKLPTEINYRANIFGFKALGVETIVSASAVGSMKETYAPTDIVFPHQFIDRTRHRPDTFFGDGIVAHVTFADPICNAVSLLVAEAGRKEGGARIHEGGTYVCIEGPQFSTRAESHLYRSWGVDVIGMTNLQEAKLAREAEICYATMALVTDYDCWRESDDVSIEQILGYLKANADMAQRIIRASIPKIAARRRDCGCAKALQFAIVTDRAVIPEDVKRNLQPIIGKYIS